MLNVLLSSAAEKFLKKCESQLRDRIIHRIERQQENPFSADAKRIVWRPERLFRIRIGDHRVLYLVEYERNELFVADIDKRSTVYDQALVFSEPAGNYMKR